LENYACSALEWFAFSPGKIFASAPSIENAWPLRRLLELARPRDAISSDHAQILFLTGVVHVHDARLVRAADTRSRGLVSPSDASVG
jgi:hypothetical protein